MLCSTVFRLVLKVGSSPNQGALYEIINKIHKMGGNKDPCSVKYMTSITMKLVGMCSTYKALAYEFDLIGLTSTSPELACSAMRFILGQTRSDDSASELEHKTHGQIRYF